MGDDTDETELKLKENLNLYDALKRPPEMGEVYKVWSKALKKIHKGWVEMNWFERVEFIILSPVYFVM